MSDEAVKAAEETAAEAAKPTITIAEKEAPVEEKAEAAPEPSPDEVHYQAVEKDGVVTAIWEMQGQKHLRTIDPRSNEGKQILALFETAA